jgi:small neutral amino acid transporter SnatA (MarC family)
MDNFLDVSMLMFFLLNPFFMSIYLLEIFSSLDRSTFAKVMVRGTLISVSVFICFAWAGDKVFSDVIHARFSSFLVFGGIIFLIMGIRFVFRGHESLSLWRGKPEHIAGSIAMPFMIGPGTVMASVVAGSKLELGWAVLSILLSVGSAVFCIIVLKFVFDHVRALNERLIQRYVMVVGRVMALVVGTFAVEMIFQGIELWLKGLKVIG